MQSLWMLLASFLFSIMGVCVKLASSYYSTAEIVAYRGVIGMLMVFVLMRWQGQSLRTRMASHHLWRGMIGVSSLWLWFYALGRLPLAMAVTLNYMSPIWLAAILFGSAYLKKQKQMETGLLLAIACGFAGVLLLLRPVIHADQIMGGIIALISGMLAAAAYLQVRQMGLMGEPESRVVFYFSTCCAIAGVIGTLLAGAMHGSSTLPVWHTHQTKSLLILLVLGITAASAQIAMTRAYRLGNPLVTANLQYAGIIFSSIWDVLIWNDALDLMSWLGIMVILASGLIATYYNNQGLRPKVAADPIASE